MGKPTTVEPGQMWRDTDQRSKGAGEFTVLAVVGSLYGDTTYLPGQGQEVLERVSAKMQYAHRYYQADAFPVAVVRRETGRLSRIRTDRLLRGPYEYLGRAR